VIRYVAALRRRPGSSAEQFLEAWLGEHQRLAHALPNVRAVLFQPSVVVPGMDLPYDGVGFLDFDSLDDLQSSLSSEQALALRAHTATFAETESVVRAVVAPPEGDVP
jgi:hypothetical protein